MLIAIKRAYEGPRPEDGYRVLVDGLWPRGASKDKLKIDQWMRDLAPSAALRKWYGHDPEKWATFRRRYRQELGTKSRKALLDEITERARKGKVTLVFGARDAEHANAAVLAELIEERLH